MLEDHGIDRELSAALDQARSMLGTHQQTEQLWREVSARVAAQAADGTSQGVEAAKRARWVTGSKVLYGLSALGVLGGIALWGLDGAKPASTEPVARSQPPPRADAVVESTVAAHEPAMSEGASPVADGTVEPTAPTRPDRPSRARRIETPRVETPRARPAKPPAAPRPDPAAEMALIERAQSDLEGSPEVALEPLIEHARHYPQGVLRQERDLLHIEALVALGRDDEARRRARAFVETFPTSPHRRRLESLASSATDEPPQNIP